MKLKDFSFELPPDAIARFPADKRDQSRLMMVDRKTRQITHHQFNELPGLLKEDEFLVVNDSRVIPVRLFGHIGESKVELLVVKQLDSHRAEALTMPGKKFKPGVKVLFTNSLWAQVEEIGDRGRRVLKFNKELEGVYRNGFAPLPPYIKRKVQEAQQYRELDLERYQTVYSREGNSIAAPTAGLHFTPELLEQIQAKHEMLRVTLNVGEATFQKLEVEEVVDHRMGREYITIPRETMTRIKELKEEKKLVAVGTTSVRSLETYAVKKPVDDTFYSELFIYPGFQFQMVDRMITNFHLPESSLFILVSAFAGLDLMQKAYAIAINEGYRFFSYGDAMFIR